LCRGAGDAGRYAAGANVVQYCQLILGGNDMNLKLTKIFQKVPEGYIGFVEELPGANTQGDTLEEVRANLEEAITLILEANRALAEEQIQGQDVIRESVSLSAA
jgi:predicted RNase H-like HicB family nuclease